MACISIVPKLTNNDPNKAAIQIKTIYRTPYIYTKALFLKQHQIDMTQYEN